MDNTRVMIYTDGACKMHSTRAGGWGAILISGKHRLEISGREEETTNNRMELTAVLEALRALTERCSVVITSDSQYVVRGTGWAKNWQQRGWLTSEKKPVKNQDLWEQLLELIQKHDVMFSWVRGHDGHPENERADVLATGAI